MLVSTWNFITAMIVLVALVIFATYGLYWITAHEGTTGGTGNTGFTGDTGCTGYTGDIVIIDGTNNIKDFKCHVKDFKCDVKDFKCDVKDFKCDVKDFKCDILDLMVHSKVEQSPTTNDNNLRKISPTANDNNLRKRSSTTNDNNLRKRSSTTNDDNLSLFSLRSPNLVRHSLSLASHFSKGSSTINDESEDLEDESSSKTELAGENNLIADTDRFHQVKQRQSSIPISSFKENFKNRAFDRNNFRLKMLAIKRLHDKHKTKRKHIRLISKTCFY